jgi:Phage tail lysozyme
MSRADATPGLRYGFLLALLLAGCLLLSPLLLLLIGQGGCGSSLLEGPITPPPPGDLSAGQMVRWFESQGDSANASAGIVGNLEQESGLDPARSGGGLAQWNPTRYGQMVAYAASVGLPATSDQGQLSYLQYDLRTNYSRLLASMDTAPDPGTAAEMLETTYELCQGVAGYMDVIPGSLCDDARRKLYAVMALAQAGGASTTTVPVSLAVLGGECAQAAAFGSGKDPIPSPPWVQERDDMGVDASAPVGAPIIAPAASTLVEVVPWFEGPCGMQPLLLFHFAREQAGTADDDQFWYVAEQITPVTETIGTTFAPAQPVAHFAACGTGIEIGWGSATSGQRTLAGQMGDAAAANPAGGSLTPWAESFKRWCHMPASWIGTSP